MNHNKPVDGSLWLFAKSGVFWSIVQSWGGRLTSFFVTLILARLLSPEDFGVASAAALLLVFIPLIAELGIGVAIVQRQYISSRSLGLPFLVGVGASIALCFLTYFFSYELSGILGGESVHEYIQYSVFLVLIIVPTLFQESMYIRKMEFKKLAARRVSSDLVAGIFAITAALLGAGVWALLIQAYVSAIIGAVWLWWSPLYKPVASFSWSESKGIFYTSLPVFLERLREFLSTRVIDLFILSMVGVAAYGVYAVAYKIYQLLFQMLHGSVYNVTLSALSKISGDKGRMSSVYIKIVSITATITTTIFVVFASLSFEISDFLYGEKWSGLGSLLQPLFILAAVQCVQYQSGAFLTALGRPGMALVTGLAKTLSIALMLFLFPSSDLSDLVWIFVISQIIVAPISFIVLWYFLRFDVAQWAKIITVSILVSYLSFALVENSRATLESLNLPIFFQGVLLGVIYMLFFFPAFFILDFKRATSLMRWVRSKGREV